MDYCRQVHHYEPEPFHEDWLTTLEALWAGTLGYSKVLFIAPPGFAKSTYISLVAPSYYLGEHPDHNLLFLTSSDIQATQFHNVLASTLELNVDHEAYFPSDRCRPNKVRGWSQNGLYLQGLDTSVKDPNYRAVGYGTRIIGARVHGIILDDPLTQESSQSVKEVASARQYHDGTLDSRLQPLEGWEVAIMTRWHEADLAAHLMAKKGWLVKHHPAIRERKWYVVGQVPQVTGGEDAKELSVVPLGSGESWGGDSPENIGIFSETDPALEPYLEDPSAVITEEIELVSLWPSRFTLEYLLGKREEDPALFECLYQGDPTAVGGAEFKFDHFTDLSKLPHGAEDKGIVFQFWDTAFSERETADFSCCVTAEYWMDGDVAIRHVHKKRLSTLALLRDMLVLGAAYRPAQIGVEKAAFRQKIIEALVNKLRQMLATARVPTVVRAINVDKDKRARAMVTKAVGETGKLYVDKSAPWYADWAAEHVGFPNKVHDDQVDATSGVIQMATDRVVLFNPVPTDYSVNGSRPKKPDSRLLLSGRGAIYVDSEGKEVLIGGN